MPVVYVDFERVHCHGDLIPSVEKTAKLSGSYSKIQKFKNAIPASERKQVIGSFDGVATLL